MLQPTDTDVICSKNKVYRSHPGNQIYDRIVGDYTKAYALATSKQDRMEITKTIVAAMEAHGARFLKPSKKQTGKWVALDETVIRDKISHKLRFAIKNHQPAVTKHRQCPSETTTCTLASTVSNDSSDAEESASELPETTPPPMMTASFTLLDSLFSSLELDIALSEEKKLNHKDVWTVADSAMRSNLMLRSEDIDSMMNGPLFQSGEWSTV